MTNETKYMVRIPGLGILGGAGLGAICNCAAVGNSEVNIVTQNFMHLTCVCAATGKARGTMNQETILIADHLRVTDDKQSREVIERYAQAIHLSIGRAEDMLDALVHLMGRRRKAVSNCQTVTPRQRAA